MNHIANGFIYVPSSKVPLSTQSQSIEKCVRGLTDLGWRGKEKGPLDNLLPFVLLDLGSSLITVFVVAAKEKKY